MENKGLIRLGILILVAIFAYFIKKERNKKQKKIDEIISKHSTKPKKTIVKTVSSEFKNQQVEYLKQLCEILTTCEKADIVINFIEENVKTNNDFENWSIVNILESQELIDYNFHQDLLIFGYYDWKQNSRELKHFIRTSLTKRFKINDSFDSIDIDKNKFIPDAFPLFEKELDKLNIKLRCIDTNSDAYTIVILKNEDLLKAEDLINKMNLKLYKVRPSNLKF